MIGTTGLLYRFSTHLVYKSNVTPRVAKLMESAGPSVTLPPISRVVWKGSRPDTGTKAIIMELGRKFRARDIPPDQRRSVVVEMFGLLEKLHNDKGIVHGDIKETNFLWSRDGKLRLVDFSSARFITEEKSGWDESFSTEAYFTPIRGVQGGVPAPTVFDDYYALAVTLWAMYAARKPGRRQFNQKTIWRTDLAKVEDDMVRAWIKKVFKMAGCRLLWPDPMEERERERDRERKGLGVGEM
ncbi:kinase-like domain-containing protein [Immersiella caudata]|uniref:Kinase-like domain-containing protein n=1 Tax=Immersiella caudata TaxID=314043 RepID=A0AA39TJG9_9PEZI|nr:kinase-like domain-containing protein [Immersiella caudata]